MLTGKTVVLGVSGGIAAYKMANVASLLVKENCNVYVIMTKNACNFISLQTFEVLTKNKCYIDTFDESGDLHVPHIALATMADCILIAPASANIIGKLANGIADDMLSTSILAATCPKLIAPSMNSNMYDNPIVQDNISKLERFGYKIIQADEGFLACRVVGKGKLPKEELLVDHIKKEIACTKDLKGKNVLVTAGPTRESIDPVRFISNNSTGKMGYAIAKNAMLRGANVTLVTGPTAISTPDFVNVINVTTAKEMYEKVIYLSDTQDIIIKAAAVADYTPTVTANEKIKKTEDVLSINLQKTNDILKEIGNNKRSNQFICGFAMETQNLIDNAKQKLLSKNVDMIVANNLKVEGAGFGTDTNVVTIITKDDIKKIDIMSKDEVASKILDEILEKFA